jgi:hypothetical protein
LANEEIEPADPADLPTPSPNPPILVGGVYALFVTDEKVLTVLNQGEVKLRPWENTGSQKQRWKVEAASGGSYGFRNMFSEGLLGVNTGGFVWAGESTLGGWETFSLVPVEDGHRFIVDNWLTIANRPLLRPDQGDYLEVQRPFFGLRGSPVTIKIVEL